MKRHLLALPLVLVAAAFARAGALDDKTVTADAKWVLHLDADALAKTETWKLIEPRLREKPEFAKGVANVERIFAAKFPADLHGVTLYGPSFDPAAAVVVIDASVDQDRLKTLLSVNDTYSTQTLGGYTIHGWQDKGRQLYGGFAGDTRLIVGQTPERVAAALDVAGGKVDALKDPALLGGMASGVRPGGDAAHADAASPGVIVYVAGSELAKLAEMKIAKNPMVGKLKDAWISAGETDAGAWLKGHVVADDAAVAQNIAKSVDGLKAALSFAEQDDSDAALFAEAMEGLTAKTAGNTVDLDWTLPVKIIGEILDRHAAKPNHAAQN